VEGGVKVSSRFCASSNAGFLRSDYGEKLGRNTKTVEVENGGEEGGDMQNEECDGSLEYLQTKRTCVLMSALGRRPHKSFRAPLPPRGLGPPAWSSQTVIDAAPRIQVEAAVQHAPGTSAFLFIFDCI